MATPAAEEVSSLLEDTLIDYDTSFLRRMWLAMWIEMRYLVPLAGPAIVVYLLNNVISMSTQIFCGHLGNLELAATSLGNNGVQLLAYGLL
ncbi:Protein DETOXIFICATION 37, partial [Bienertia sinuspersici]